MGVCEGKFGRCIAPSRLCSDVMTVPVVLCVGPLVAAAHIVKTFGHEAVGVGADHLASLYTTLRTLDPMHTGYGASACVHVCAFWSV